MDNNRKREGFFSRYGVLMGAVLLLAGACVLSFRYGTGDQTKETAIAAAAPEAAQEQPAAGTDYFEQFRAEREAVRGTEIEYLDEVIATSSSDAETLADAQAQKLALVENMDREFTVEALLRAKGFEDAAVTFREGSVNVIVDCEALSGEQVAQILDIVQRETGERAENVKVMSSK